MKKNTMKLDAFKKLIREAVREEVRDIIREELHQFGKYINTQSVVKTPSSKKAPSNFMDDSLEGNTIESLIKETASNMSREDYRTIVNANSSMASGFVPPPTPSPSFYSNNNSTEANINDIDVGVPDFRALMGVMKEKNMI